jgi:hypothetical protein
MKKMKAMYRRDTILARNISLDLSFRLFLNFWFHERLTPAFVTILHAFTEFGSGEWIGIVLCALVLFFVWKRSWPSLVMLIIAVPGGMFLNEWLKLAVHRQRPFVEGP